VRNDDKSNLINGKKGEKLQGEAYFHGVRLEVQIAASSRWSSILFFPMKQIFRFRRIF
jgi:hypothetical protein